MTGTYLAVFWFAFLAATIVPIASEIGIVTALGAGAEPLTLWAVATLGNTAGAAVNWLLGRFLIRFADRRWFPVSRGSIEKAERWFTRYGRWSLLFAWVPIVGDPLTFAAGLLRVPFGVFVLLVAIGKGARYAVVTAAAVGLA